MSDDVMMDRQHAPPAERVLEITSIAKSFGGLEVLTDVNLSIEAGRIIGLIGPNGAGKSTLFNIISRIEEPRSGSIVYLGGNLLARGAHDLAQLGIGRTFQNLALFPNLTVRETVTLPLLALDGLKLHRDLLPVGRLGAARRARHETVDRALDLVGLRDLADDRVGDLPYAHRKRVELARALMVDPRLLLLDEPAGGLNRTEVAALSDVLRTIREDRGCALLVVEHNMDFVMSLCSYVYVLHNGELIGEGPPEVVGRMPAVVEAYLGDPYDAA